MQWGTELLPQFLRLFCSWFQVSRHRSYPRRYKKTARTVPAVFCHTRQTENTVPVPLRRPSSPVHGHFAPTQLSRKSGKASVSERDTNMLLCFRLPIFSVFLFPSWDTAPSTLLLLFRTLDAVDRIKDIPRHRYANDI